KSANWPTDSRPLGEVERSDAVVEDRPLHLLDGLGDLDVPGAGLGAAEGGAAPPHAGPLVEDVEPFRPRLVPRVEDEAVGVDDGGRAHVGLVAPVDRARRRARRTQDALGGVVEPLPLLGALVALLVARVG